MPVKFKSSIIRQKLIDEISSGNYQVGDRLPPERELCERFAISRPAMREAITLLVNENIIDRRQGSGTYLVRHPGERPRNRVVGILTFGIGRRYTIFSDILHHMEEELSRNNYSLVLANHANSVDKAEKHLDNLIRLNVAGIAFAPIVLPDFQEENLMLIRKMEKAGIPFVLFNCPVSAQTITRYSFVGIDNFSAMRKAAVCMAEKGCRRIAYIRGLPGVPDADQRFDGFIEGMRDCNLELRPEYIKSIKRDEVSRQGHEETRELLALPEPPDAIICSHDQIAFNCMDELVRNGIQPQKEIMVVGFDGTILPDAATHPFYPVRQPVREIAASVVELLMDKLERRSLGERQIMLPCEICM